MRIVEQKSVGNVGGARGARGASGSGARFTIDQGATSTKAEAKAPISILGGLEALIAIQSEDNTREKRKRSLKRGQSMLDVLDELKLALLSGHLPANIQSRLGMVLQDTGASGDPRLDGIVDAIELRAEVELAKLRQAQRRES
ncbi:MAG: flagellar assembly protein fliX [Proteobacteria bacterium]|nr:flagellar assembly protein fliX [Pseudomonadota bacterium]